MVIRAYKMTREGGLREAVKAIITSGTGSLTRTMGMIVPNWTDATRPSGAEVRDLLEQRLQSDHPIFVRSLTGWRQSETFWKLRSLIVSPIFGTEVVDVSEKGLFPVKLRGHVLYGEAQLTHEMFTLAWAIGHRRTQKIELKFAESLRDGVHDRLLTQAVDAYRKGIWHLVKLDEMFSHVFPDETRARREALNYAWARACFSDHWAFGGQEEWTPLGGSLYFDLERLFEKKVGSIPFHEVH